jgi:hypothetical protein
MHTLSERIVVDLPRREIIRSSALIRSYGSRTSCIDGYLCRRLFDSTLVQGVPCTRGRLLSRIGRKLAYRPPRPGTPAPRTVCLADGISGPLSLPTRIIRSVDLGLSRHDAEIFRLAIPALCSTLLDPLMGVVDTGMHLGTCLINRFVRTVDCLKV